MAKIILLAQKFSTAELLQSINGNKIEKTFFQCVLKSISSDNATFGLVAYAAKKNPKIGGKNWILGTPIYGKPDPFGTNREFDLSKFDPDKDPIAFGNMEVKLKLKSILEFLVSPEEKEDYKTNQKEVDQHKEFINALNKIAEDKKLLAACSLVFEGNISKNPHVEYTVNIEGTSSGAQANPCPPFDPGE